MIDGYSLLWHTSQSVTKIGHSREVVYQSAQYQFFFFFFFFSLYWFIPINFFFFFFFGWKAYILINKNSITYEITSAQIILQIRPATPMKFFSHHSTSALQYSTQPHANMTTILQQNFYLQKEIKRRFGEVPIVTYERLPAQRISISFLHIFREFWKKFSMIRLRHVCHHHHLVFSLLTS